MTCFVICLIASAGFVSVALIDKPIDKNTQEKRIALTQKKYVEAETVKKASCGPNMVVIGLKPGFVQAQDRNGVCRTLATSSKEMNVGDTVVSINYITKDSNGVEQFVTVVEKEKK